MGLHLEAEELVCKPSSQVPPQRNGFHPRNPSEAVHSSTGAVMLPLSRPGRAEMIAAGDQSSLAERPNAAGSASLAEAAYVQPPRPTGNVQQGGSGPPREPVQHSIPPAEPIPLPDTVNIVCGITRGVLHLKRLRVSFEGREISCPEFERIAGREKNKKWKSSFRVVENGIDGTCVETWLKYKGWAVLQDSIVTLSVAEQHQEAARQRVAKRAAAQAVEVLPPVLPEYDQDGLPCIWRLISTPCDPSLGPLPKELPPHPEQSMPAQNVVSLDLRQMSAAELMALSAQSAEAPLQDLLDEQPGIFPVNMAFLTGHKPLRGSVVGKEDAAVQLAQYLRGELSELPWSTLGVSRAPIVAGQYLELRLLYQAVHGLGGYDEVCREKLWDSVCATLGMGTAGSTSSHVKSILRGHYKRFLLQHERQERAFSIVKQPRTRGQRSETERAKEVAGKRAWSSDVAEGGEHEDGEPSQGGSAKVGEVGHDPVRAVLNADGEEIDTQVKMDGGEERMMDEGEEGHGSEEEGADLDDYVDEEEEEGGEDYGDGEASVDDEGGGDEIETDGDDNMDDVMDTDDEEDDGEAGEGPMEESDEGGEGAEESRRRGGIAEASIDLVSPESSGLKPERVLGSGSDGVIVLGSSEDER